MVTKNTHVLIELDERETHLLRELLDRLEGPLESVADSEYGRELDRMRVDLRFKLPQQK